MRLSSLCIAALALTFAVSAPAKSRKKKKVTKVEVAKPDTVSVDTFSYAMGMAQSAGLKAYLSQRMGIDTAYMADFEKGLAEAIAKPGDKKLAAYAAGVQIGQQLHGQIMPGVNRQITDQQDAPFVNEKLFSQGFLDGVCERSNVMTADKANAIAIKQMEFYQKELTERKFGKNRTEGEAFLKENAKKDSVKTLKTGLQYKVIKKGTGPVPTDTSKVKVNYEGRLLDGTVFDSSYERKQPAVFGCNQVIKGWTEALTNMPVGSVWEIYIPQEKGYGERQAGKIPPYSLLIFKVELLGIEK